MAGIYAYKLVLLRRVTFGNKQSSKCLGAIALASKIEENYFKARVYELLEVLSKWQKCMLRSC